MNKNMSVKTVRKVEYLNTAGPLGMNDPKVVEEYSKMTARGSFIFELVVKRYAKKNILSLKPDAEVIADIGTGPGLLPVILAKITSKKVYAVDTSPNMLKKAAELAAKSGVEINIVEADCKNLPFADMSLDLVISTNLIHALDDVLPFFIELKRVIKPGGKAFITGFRRDTWSIIRKLGDFHTNVILRNSPMDGMGPVFNASFTKEEIEELLREAGLYDFSVKTGIVGLKTIINF